MPKPERRDTTMRAFASLDAAGETRAIDEQARSIDFVCSTEDQDGHGTVIDQASWKLDRHARNPIVLWNHGTSSMFGGKPKDEIPIARAENVRVENGKLRARVVFPPAGEFELSDHVWNAVRSKRVNGISVGFKPGKVARETVDGRERYRLFNCELYELSLTPLPSNAYTVAERSLLAKMAGRADVVGCSEDECCGPEDCGDELCVCACHGDRTTKAAPRASTEKRTMLEILARMLGCTADEASIVAAIESLKTRVSVEPTTLALDSTAVSFDEERSALTAQIETTKGIVRSLIESLGLAADAPAGEAAKAIVTLQSRAALADQLEPKVAALSADLAKRDEVEAVREVDFLVSRGKQYGLTFDERSRKALIAYRKSDAVGFAEDYKAALDGLRAFDDSALFANIAGPKTAPLPDPESMATKAIVVDAMAEIERLATEAQKANSSLSRADALELARKKL